MGFQAFQRMDGGSPTAGMTPVWIASTDATFMFRGDPVVTSSAGGTNLSGAYITSVALAGNSSSFLVRGIFQGCYQFSPAAGRVIWTNFYGGSVTGSTGDIKAYVIDDPEEMFLVQASTNSAITSSMIGLNVSISTGSTTGSQTLGYSNVVLQSTSVTASGSYPFRLVDFFSAYAPGIAGFGNVNANANIANPIINGTDNANPANMVIVRMNNCDRLSTTARSS